MKRKTIVKPRKETKKKMFPFTRNLFHTPDLVNTKELYSEKKNEKV